MQNIISFHFSFRCKMWPGHVQILWHEKKSSNQSVNKYIKYSAITHLPSCFSRTIWLTFFYVTQKEIFHRNMFPCNESKHWPGSVMLQKDKKSTIKLSICLCAIFQVFWSPTFGLMSIKQNASFLVHHMTSENLEYRNINIILYKYNIL